MGLPGARAHSDSQAGPVLTAGGRHSSCPAGLSPEHRDATGLSECGRPRGGTCSWFQHFLWPCRPGGCPAWGKAARLWRARRAAWQGPGGASPGPPGHHLSRGAPSPAWPPSVALSQQGWAGRPCQPCQGRAPEAQPSDGTGVLLLEAARAPGAGAQQGGQMMTCHTQPGHRAVWTPRHLQGPRGFCEDTPAGSPASHLRHRHTGPGRRPA